MHTFDWIEFFSVGTTVNSKKVLELELWIIQTEYDREHVIPINSSSKPV